MTDAQCRSQQPQPYFPKAQNSHAAVSANETRRRHKHGRLHPMHKPSFLERLLGRG